MDAFAACGVDPTFYANRLRDREEVFPWTVISDGVTEKFLWREREQAYAGKITPTAGRNVPAAAPTVYAKEGFAMPDQRILFSKSGTAKYISHLDLMHTMERAFLRAGITIRHTAGFHPHPYVSIPLPLPLGFSSQCELMEFGLEEGCTMEELPQKMNQVLPRPVFVIHDCYEGGLPFPGPLLRPV